MTQYFHNSCYSLPEIETVPEPDPSQYKKKTDLISSKFIWDKKTILWNLVNISSAIGKPPPEVGAGDAARTTAVYRNPNFDGHEVSSLLDVDHVNSLRFNAGTHPENRSQWSMSLFKSADNKYLGLNLHLLEIEYNTYLNNNRQNSPYEEEELPSLYIQGSMRVVTQQGLIVHKIDIPSIVNLMDGNCWSQEQFILLEQLWDPDSHFVTDDTLRIEIELSILHQLLHKLEEEVDVASLETLRVRVSELVIDDPTASSKLLESMWKNRGFTDVTVNCGNKSFSLHKCVVAVASPVFEAKFKEDMPNNEVTVTDVEPKILEHMFEFIYLGKLSETWNWDDFELLTELLIATDKYRLDSLKNLCLTTMCERISMANVGYLVVAFDSLDAADVYKKVVYKFIARNIKLLRVIPEFIELVSRNAAAFAPVLFSDAVADLID